MKGRPITTEEFERMLSKVSEVVSDDRADCYNLLLRGIWTSGLWLGEALALRWNQQPGGVSVLLDGRKSVLAFDADSQKSDKVQLVPLAPEAVHLLEPHRRERGFVFWLPKRDTDKVSKIITKIGKAAKVVVDTKTGKFASAHDLRRAFDYRWSRRVMPAVLKELMRHASIETTMTYNVGKNAEATAAELWRLSGNNALFGASETTPETDVNHYNKATSARSSVG